MMRLRTILVLIIMATGVGLIGAESSKPVDLKLRDLAARRVRLLEHRGKIVVLNFWATWCNSCKEEMPMLMAAAKEYGPRGVAFIGASVDDAKTRRKIPEFLTAYRVDFPIWIGVDATHLTGLRMGDIMPCTAFIDRDGRIVARIQGKMMRQELNERLEWLLGDRTPPPPPPLIRHFGID